MPDKRLCNLLPAATKGSLPLAAQVMVPRLRVLARRPDPRGLSKFWAQQRAEVLLCASELRGKSEPHKEGSVKRQSPRAPPSIMGYVCLGQK